MICGENNHHVHDGYEEETAPSSDVNYTDEDETALALKTKARSKNTKRQGMPSEMPV